MKINRPDLADKTLNKLKQLDEDNCLTVLASTWLTLYKSGMKSTVDDLITSLNQMSERVGGYSTKTYNLLGMALLLKNNVNKAAEIFQVAIDELGLGSEEG